jgi:parvulin-like peptidyl-prolyl isomerase
VRRLLLPGALLAALVVLVIVSGCGGGKSARPADGVSGSSSARVWRPGVPDTLGPVVAVVGTRRIRAHEIDSIIATAPPNMQAQLREKEGYKNLVDRVATEEAVYQAALRAGTENDPLYRAAVAKASRDAMMRTYYQRRAAGFGEAGDSAVQAFYDSHRNEFEIPARARVRHIQTTTKAKAASLRKRLASGGLWDATARANSTDKATRETGGVLGFITPSTTYVPGVGNAPDLVTAAFGLKEGEISQPIKSEKAWHLIQVDQVEPVRVQPLSEVRGGIVARLTQENEQANARQFIDSLKTAAGTTIFEDSIAVAVRPERTAQELFQAAQAAASPEKRIDLYRAVAAQFPSDSVSVQAEFMIGFTYAEDLERYDEARAEFQKFIAKHPNSELAKSARWMLENMDKPAPELKDLPEGPGGTGAPPDSIR